MKPYRIQFPVDQSLDLGQDEVSFVLYEDGEPITLRFHDYPEIYARPGLYEQLFYERLKCASPSKVASILRSAVEQAGGQVTTLRVLDLGAGNGIMGEELRRLGVARILGADIIPEAAESCFRDRAGLYDDYLVADVADPTPEVINRLESWNFDCLTTVAAIGFGDIPATAFVNSLNAIRTGGWVGFNIRDSFLDYHADDDFSVKIRELVFGEYLQIHHLERYRHRLSIDGEPIYYYAIAARKNSDVPLDELLTAQELATV